MSFIVGPFGFSRCYFSTVLLRDYVHQPFVQSRDVGVSAAARPPSLFLGNSLMWCAIRTKWLFPFRPTVVHWLSGCWERVSTYIIPAMPAATITNLWAGKFGSSALTALKTVGPRKPLTCLGLGSSAKFWCVCKTQTLTNKIQFSRPPGGATRAESHKVFNFQ